MQIRISNGPWTRLCSLLLCLTVCLSLLPARGLAAQEGRKTVRVGWFYSEMFQQGMADDQEKSGYCYDYLQTVSNYTKWKYEYVYGDWTDLYRKLLSGEIDMLAGVSRTEERRNLMLFPDTPMGTDQYYIYKHDTDTSVSADDLSTLSGKRIGAIVDNRTTDFIQQWMADNQVDLELVYFESFEKQRLAFERGELDLQAQTIYNVLSVEGISMVAKVGEEPFYLAVGKSRSDLVAELNTAVATILSTNPFILQDLQYENYGTTLTGKNLSDAEQQWIDAHPMITVGYFDNYLPFSNLTETGEVTGIVTDVLDAIFSVLNLKDRIFIQYVPFDNYVDMVSALNADSIDMAFPVYGNRWYLEQDGIYATSAVLSGSDTLFCKGEFMENGIRTVAVNANNRMQIAYCQRIFPDASLCYFDSIEACLDAVQDGFVDGTIVNTLRTELVTGNTKYRNLSQIQLPVKEDRCFGVNDCNTELMMFLNRGLSLIGSTYGLDNAYKYISQLHVYDAKDFIRENMLVIGLISTVLAVLIITLLSVSLRRKERYISEIAELRNKAEASNKAKTSFLFNMSHDIRTPMNAIIGYNRLMKIHRNDPEKLDDYIQKIDTSSRFLLSLINSVLEMARIESGSATLKEEVWSAGQFNETLYAVFDGQMRRKNITFTRDICVRHEFVYCDPVMLRQVFLNILSNAYKYTPEGGRIHLMLEEFPSERDGYVSYRTTISDTGIGMSEEFLPSIFEEFSREKTVTDSRIEGTGLGLPIVKKLVELMGGSIEVRSRLGEGTTFIVTLEHRIATKMAPNPEANVDIWRKKFSGKRILLAEDNDMNAEIAEEILSEVGFAVERAADGRICVDMLTGSADDYYSVILMDIQMPNMNGYEATRKIRALPEAAKADIPIVAMTANAFESDRKNAFDAGMNGHLSKPIEVPKLMDMLAEVLE